MSFCFQQTSHNTDLQEILTPTSASAKKSLKTKKKQSASVVSVSSTRRHPTLSSSKVAKNKKISSSRSSSSRSPARRVPTKGFKSKKSKRKIKGRKGRLERDNSSSGSSTSSSGRGTSIGSPFSSSAPSPFSSSDEAVVLEDWSPYRGALEFNNSTADSDSFSPQSIEMIQASYQHARSMQVRLLLYLLYAFHTLCWTPQCVLRNAAFMNSASNEFVLLPLVLWHSLRATSVIFSIGNVKCDNGTKVLKLFCSSTTFCFRLSYCFISFPRLLYFNVVSCFEIQIFLSIFFSVY